MDRNKRQQQIEDALNAQGRTLFWFGPRGSDAMGLRLFHDHFAGSFALYDRFFPSDTTDTKDNFVALEDLTLKRRLSRAFDEDPDSFPGEYQFRKLLSTALKSEIVKGNIPTVIAYEPHAVLETIINQDPIAEFFGNDIHDFRRVSSKPYVERALLALGVPVIPWKAIDGYDQVQELANAYSSLIIRRDGGSSGKGIISFRDGDDEAQVGREIREMLASHAAVVSASELFENAVSLNASGVVFPQGGRNKPIQVATFPVNAQLVGQPQLTSLEFGYSGNDFHFPFGLDNEILLQCDEILKTTGQWLGSKGYIGAFGVDLLLTKDGRLFFTELNARFQGSTRLLSRITGRAGQSDVLMEHLAATLGLPFGGTLTAPQWTDEINPFSQMYLHNVNNVPVSLSQSAAPKGSDPNAVANPIASHVEYEMVPDNHDLTIESGALVERVVVRGSVLSSDGRTLSDKAKALLQPSLERYEPSLTRDDIVLAR
ncbi:MAG: ATP-grasp domain-containing protein [Acidimicrobiia bacterium]